MRYKLLVAGTTAAVAVGAVGVWAAGSAFAATARYEAETSPAICAGTIDTEHSGFSGSGFCNGTNSTSGYAQFTATASAAGTATLGVRFANGTTSSRAASLVVNGTTVQSVSFEGTGAWNTWVTKTLTVTLNAGSNTIRFTPTASAGLANIDYLDVTTNGTSPTTPPPSTPPPTTTPPPAGDTLFVAPNGSDSAAGTQANPTTLTSAITRIAAGGTISMRGGTYNLSQTVTIAQNNNGTASARKNLFAHQGETPILNFSAQSEDPANRGLAIGGSYWHIRGIIVERAGDNGILLGGHNNIIERVITRHNRDSGLQLSRLVAGAPRDQWPSNNLVLSSVSHDNVDSDGEDADGFAPKLTVGSGNVFRYTVAHNNIDDGYDLYTYSDYDPIGAVTIEDSLAYDNGTLSNGGQAGAGDRNGFKLGGEDVPINHTFRRNIAIDNGQHGITYNRNLGTMTISNNLAIGNTERNFNFDGGSSVFRNNTSCNSGDNDRIIGNSDGSNQFWSGTNGSRCANFSGSLAWSFASDGRLVVTLGGRTVTL
ncbi:CBM35 domain-containing protein [Actinomycetes bacterium KLBMP 9797]